jgi:hypothetical protein
MTTSSRLRAAGREISAESNPVAVDHYGLLHPADGQEARQMPAKRAAQQKVVEMVRSEKTVPEAKMMA